MMHTMAKDVASMKHTIKLMRLWAQLEEQFRAEPTKEEHEYQRAVLEQAIEELRIEFHQEQAMTKLRAEFQK